MALNKFTQIGNSGFGTDTSINTTGIVTAASFSGDGSGLTGVTALGSGVVVQEEGSNVGTAQTINFIGTGVTATFSGGIASVEISTSGGGGGSLSNVVEDTTPQLGGNLDLNSNNITGTGDINITGDATFSGDLDVDGHVDLDNVSIAGVVTATTFVGALTGDASGNAATATTLQNARTIGGVSFDGSANINLPGVNAAGNQDTSGTASVATNVTVANEASDTECFVMFGVNATGNNAPKSSSSLKYNSSTGGLSAGSFIGDGSGLTGITASGSGVIVRDGGSLVGTAGTIDFGSNVSVSPISAGVVTVTAAAGSIPGISTAQTTQLNNLTVAGVSTFTGAIDANGDLDVDGHTNLDNVSVAGVVTATSFVRTSGTSSQFLKADGSVDSSTYLTSYTETDPVVAAINGIVKSNGSTISAATAGTDYLSPTGDGSGLTGIAVTAFTNVQATWSVGGDTGGYTFTGPGQDGAEQNPDIYLVRGQRYRFINTTGSGHPFEIRVSNGGSAYTDGITGSTSGTQDFNVQHDAPVRLYYQCTIHSGMIGNIYIVGGSDWRMTDVATNATPEIFTNLNVGIGTDNPATNFKLDVNGDLSLGELGGSDNTYIDQKQNGQLDIINSGRSANNGRVRINKTNSISGDTTYFRDFEVYDGKDNLVLLVDGSSSRIGIGTDNPQEKLHIHEGDVVIGQNSGNNTDIRNYIKFGRVDAPKAAIGFVNNAGSGRGDIIFVNDNTADASAFSDSDIKLRVRSDGDVFIGDNDLQSQLGSRRRLAVSDTTNGALLHLRGQSPAIFFDQSGGGTGEIYLDGAGLEVHSGTPASAGTQVFNIDSNGYRSFSTQPYVLLRKDGTTQNMTADAIVQFNSTVTSEGGMTVNASRSRITVPKAGKYAVLGAVAGTNTTVSVGDGWRLDLYRDGAVYGNGYTYPINTVGASTGEEYTLQTSLIVPADANDYFEFKVSSVGSARANVRYGYFCVYYLG